MKISFTGTIPINPVSNEGNEKEIKKTPKQSNKNINKVYELLGNSANKPVINRTMQILFKNDDIYSSTKYTTMFGGKRSASSPFVIIMPQKPKEDYINNLVNNSQNILCAVICAYGTDGKEKFITCTLEKDNIIKILVTDMCTNDVEKIETIKCQGDDTDKIIKKQVNQIIEKFGTDNIIQTAVSTVS